MNKIITLGHFDIIINGQSIIDSMGDQKRLVRLFKYFLIHNNTRLLSEKIIEDLYEREDSKDPLNMLREQIFRLRKAMKENELNIQPFFSIEYVNGYYVFELEENIKVDFIEFEEALEDDILRINQVIKKDHLRFKELLLLYNGDLLIDLDDHWIIPTRIKFDRLYTKGLLSYMDYLKKKEMYIEIIEIGERAVSLKPYDESIAINFMEALVKLEQKEHALMYYEFFTKRLYDDLRVYPSKKIIQFYNENKFKSDDSDLTMNFDIINKEVDIEFDSESVIFCDYNNFKFMYNNELLNKDRIGPSVALAIVSLESKNYRELTEKEIFKGMKLLESLFYKYLKPVDLVSEWNEKQMLMLLYDIEKDEIEKLVRDINQKFDLKKIDSNLRLNIKIKNL